MLDINDKVGYDILSYDVDSSKKLIEVKLFYYYLKKLLKNINYY